MTHPLARLRIYLNRIPVPGWLHCLMGEHDEWHHQDGDNHWWVKCKRCRWMKEDNRVFISMHGPEI